MNSDEIMSDPAGPRNPTAEPGPKSSTWNNKKFRDDYNSYKSRLQHQKFSSAEYPDPLAPRPPHPLRYPQGTGPEVEEKLKKLIADIKAGNSGVFPLDGAQPCFEIYSATDLFERVLS